MTIILRCDEPGCGLQTVALAYGSRLEVPLPALWSRTFADTYAPAGHVDTYCPRCTRDRSDKAESNRRDRAAGGG